MRVLAVVHLYPPHHNAGAEWMLHSILRRWVELGDECAVLVRDLDRSVDPYTLHGVTVEPLVTDDLAKVAGWNDLVVTHLDLTQQATAAAEAAGRPIVHLVHNDRQLRYHRVVPGPRVLAAFNSEWIADEVRRRYWRRGAWTVCRPHVRLDDYRTTPGELVTLINASPPKGSRTLWNVARAQPDRRFLAVRGAYNRQDTSRAPRNVEVIDQTPRVRDEVYARTRVLLMPSGYESWGRTAIEAAASGIPTIGSPTAGLAESLGDAGIWCNPRDTADWCAVLDCLDDPTEWAHHSVLARERAAEVEQLTAADVDDLRERASDLVTSTPRRSPSGSEPVVVGTTAPREPPVVEAAGVSVLIPYLAADEYGVVEGAERAAAYRHVRRAYEDRHPDWQVVPAPLPGPEWSKGEALRRARPRATGDVLVIADADCLLPPGPLLRCVQVVASRSSAWAMPYRTVRRLDDRTTREVLAGHVLKRARTEPGRPPHKAVDGGGIVVVAADVFDDVGGIDPRFVGWGGEDAVFGWVLRALHGGPFRMPGEVLHLWHPPAPGSPRDRSRPEHPASVALLGRYRSARRNVEALRALIREHQHPDR